MTEKKVLDIGELRAQSPYISSDTRVVLVTNDETLMPLLGELQLTKCWPDTTDEHGEWVRTFKIQVERKNQP